jgi:hypothetical protein
VAVSAGSVHPSTCERFSSIVPDGYLSALSVVWAVCVAIKPVFVPLLVCFSFHECRVDVSLPLYWKSSKILIRQLRVHGCSRRALWLKAVLGSRQSLQWLLSRPSTQTSPFSQISSCETLVNTQGSNCRLLLTRCRRRTSPIWKTSN